MFRGNVGEAFEVEPMPSAGNVRQQGLVSIIRDANEERTITIEHAVLLDFEAQVAQAPQRVALFQLLELATQLRSVPADQALMQRHKYDDKHDQESQDDSGGDGQEKSFTKSRRRSAGLIRTVSLQDDSLHL